MEETYTIKVSCENCDYSGIEQKPKGQRIVDWDKKVCPDCGCYTLREHKYIESPIRSDMKNKM